MSFDGIPWLRKQTPAPSWVVDRRKLAAQSHHGYATRGRSIGRVTGVCLHQTACQLGERIERYDSVGAHLAITRSGRVIWLHAFDRLVVHGNGWNAGTIGIEMDGLYAGVDGRPETVWDNPATAAREVGQDLPEAAAKAAIEAIAWIRESVPSVRVIVAHRQAAASRRNDPGSAIWQRVALACGLEVANDTTLGDGLPIPREWDPRSPHRY